MNPLTPIRQNSDSLLKIRDNSEMFLMLQFLQKRAFRSRSPGDGSFSTTILLDRDLFERQAIQRFKPCVDYCELVVSNGYGEPARLATTRTGG